MVVAASKENYVSAFSAVRNLSFNSPDNKKRFDVAGLKDERIYSNSFAAESDRL